MKILLIKPGASAAEEIESGDSLKELQALVGGYIEAVTVFFSETDIRQGFVNEDGLYTNLEPNRLAVSLTGHSIVGNLVVMPKGWRDSRE